MQHQSSFELVHIGDAGANNWTLWIVGGCLAIAFFIVLVVLPVIRK